ncbi:hypothetical protein PT974_12543 [Cladobotryum mycophilum]|uniref:Uncharacterized protein n=1 Tax=Cladobotryum mycophilum TaxID=491253 RepID=A0ABR0S894_9HYPO
MPMKKENRSIFDKLRRQYGIFIRDDLPDTEWPPEIQEELLAIKKVTTYKYSTYSACRDNGGDADATPWRELAKTQAEKLTEKAKDCVDRNEATWRFACEPLVFSRLSAEVACTLCRQRVWRAEVEAKQYSESRTAADLRRRQEGRDRCRCPITTRSQDDKEERVGLNKLFIDRSDDVVIHPPDLANKLPQEQRPDRVYGIRRTRNFEDLLFKNLEDGRFVDDLLEQQPHSAMEGEPLLFPFLVIEAKAGNAPDSWDSIKKQTAFPIYAYLNLQRSLKYATIHKSEWESGPLVWFFMSKGEYWRLCLAYQIPLVSPSSDDNQYSTVISEVWKGCITKHDDALQLFLLVDHISDWARDVYRPTILKELKLITGSGSDVTSVFADSDIFSSKHHAPPPNASFTVDPSTSIDVRKAFRALDSASGAIRHVASIESRFRCLFITADNVVTFSDSLESKIRKIVARNILNRFHAASKEFCILTLDQLNAMEVIWTGHSRPAAPFHIRNNKFYAIHVLSFYFSPSWEMIRDLCIIAISPDAFGKLITDSRLKVGRCNATIPQIGVNGDNLDNTYYAMLNRISLIKNASPQWNLHASIRRLAASIDPDVEEKSTPAMDWFYQTDARIWEIVSCTYQIHKSGDVEPEKSFLRISKSCETWDGDFDKPSQADLNPRDVSLGQVVIGAEPDIGSLQISDDDAVLIYGWSSQPRSGKNLPNLCVYIVRGPLQPPNGDDVAGIIGRTFENRDVYHTTRYNGFLSFPSMQKKYDIWNLEKSYGVHFALGRDSFSAWLKDLNHPMPSRQGSPRGPNCNGRASIFREYHPWHDPRHVADKAYCNARKEYLKELIKTETKTWIEIAYSRFQNATICCLLCSVAIDWERTGDGINGFCEICQSHLAGAIPPSWPTSQKRFLWKAFNEAISNVYSQKKRESDMESIAGNEDASRPPRSNLELATDSTSLDNAEDSRKEKGPSYFFRLWNTMSECYANANATRSLTLHHVWYVYEEPSLVPPLGEEGGNVRKRKRIKMDAEEDEKQNLVIKQNMTEH